ncbi:MULTISPECIES: LysR family transcriptional regulator [Paenibacillus]|uniref:LysR family transcriptional regulator n=1 Tax=Paenibacillus TaxID=44249 RepID=UPI001643D374|nr:MULTISPECIES: LysR family transcriptional regulator [Paenibacillus]
MTHLQLEVFLNIYETGSFTKAAQKLSMTQSAVSHSIAGLEKVLGIHLFERGHKMVKITEAGTLILPHVREIFNQEAIIRQKTAALLDCETGAIKVGTFPSFMANVLPEFLKAFKRQYPGINVEVFEGGYHEIHEWVHEADIDFGISIESEDHAFIPLMRDPMYVVMPIGHALQQLEVLTVESLSGEPYINVKGYETLLEEIMQNSGVRLNVQYHLHNTYSIISAVEAGLGITLLPEMALPKTTEKIYCTPLHPLFTRMIGIIHRSPSTLTPAAKSFVDFLMTRIGFDKGEKAYDASRKA